MNESAEIAENSHFHWNLALFKSEGKKC